MKKIPVGKNEEIEKRFAALLPEPVVSIAKLGSDALVEDVSVDFVFLLIEENELHRFASSSSNAIQIATDHNAIVVSNTGGLIQLAAGPRTDMVDCTAKRNDLVSDLIRTLGASVRIVHGRAQSYVGTVGTESRKNWGYFPIAIVQILRTLLASTPGLPVDLDNQFGKN